MEYKIGRTLITMFHGEEYDRRSARTAFFYTMLPTVTFYRSKSRSHARMKIIRVRYYGI